MKKIIFALIIASSLTSVHADDKAKELGDKLERIENLSIAVKKRLHPEVMEALPAADKESMLERLKVHESELKKMNSQLREQFDQLDPEAQRDILLRQVK